MKNKGRVGPWPPTEERFWLSIRRAGPDECWMWRDGKSTKGYSVFRYGGRDGLGHRYSYELHHGPIPRDMFVLHRCDNPPCVNPAHLFLGTAADNARDKVQKGRCRNGITPKLTAEQVTDIRARFIAGEARQALARAYGVSFPAIHDIVANEAWVGVGRADEALGVLRSNASLCARRLHPMTPANVYCRPSKPAARNCRACRSEYQRLRCAQRAKKEAA